MATSIRALVTPEVLAWARGLDSLSIEEASTKLKVTAAKVEEWEKGISFPTLRQAKDLARFYRIPFVYFYLPDIPQKTKRIDKVDFRTFGNIGDPFGMSRELRWLLRDIEERRDTMINLYQTEEMIIQPFISQFPTNTDSAIVATFIREMLNLTYDKQKKFRKPETLLAYCIEQLEKADFLVFQAAKIDPSEMRGLSLGYTTFPIIVLNRKDEPSARLFTLIHELAHIILGTSGICNDVSEQSSSSNAIEMRCNQIAGLSLVPEREFKGHPILRDIKKYGLDDTLVAAIARDFAVSKEVVLHHLWTEKIINRDKYFETLKQYSDAYLAYKKQKKGGFLPPAMDKGTQVGKLYARTVMNLYHGDKISARDASNYLLNLGTQHFGKIERWCF